MIGAALRRVEDRRFLLGEGRFVDDLPFPEALHCAFVRSPHPHARILSIELPEGVRGFTGRDLAGVAPMRAGWALPGMVEPPRFALARDSVRHVGEPVAAVFAATRELAEDAADRVEVNGMRVYYEVFGEGDPLVVLHGAYMAIPSMGAIIPKLAETHRVYALEFQGHGRTNDIDRPITYQNLADDVAAFMDAIGLERADVFGYSMGAGAGLQLAIRHPEKVRRLVAASVAYDLEGWQPVFTEFIPQMSPEMMVGTPMEAEYRKLAADPDGFRALVEKLIALEHEPMAWEGDVRALATPVLVIAGDADVVTLEHSVALFRLLGGGVMGDMGTPLPASRLAVLPATSHTAVIGQTDLLHALIEPFLRGETPKGMFDGGGP